MYRTNFLEDGNGVAVCPYSFIYVSFDATIDGEPRTGFFFAFANTVPHTLRAELEARGCSIVKIEYTAAIERDDEAGYPDFRAWLHAVDSNGPRWIGSRIVVLRAAT